MNLLCSSPDGAPVVALDGELSDTARCPYRGPDVGAEMSPLPETEKRYESLWEAFVGAFLGPPALGVNPATFTYGLDFLRDLHRSLPRSAPLPEISFDNDGDIAFEWDMGPRRIFSIRVSSDGTVYFAGLNGASTIHGTEPYSVGIPKSVAEGISRVIKETPARF